MISEIIHRDVKRIFLVLAMAMFGGLSFGFVLGDRIHPCIGCEAAAGDDAQRRVRSCGCETDAEVSALMRCQEERMEERVDSIVLIEQCREKLKAYELDAPP